MTLPDRHHPCRLSAEAYGEPNRVVFITTCTKSRRSLLTDESWAATVTSLARDCAEACNLHLVAYCVMPDHVHLVVATKPDSAVTEYVRRLKGRVAKELHEKGVTGEVWEKSYWDRHARHWENARAMIEYVLHNPVRKGLSDTASKWPFSAFLGFPWDDTQKGRVG